MWDGIAYTSHNSELLETSLVSKLCCKATEDEKNIIRYYAARGEKDKVEEFYKLMERELNKRLQTTVNEQTRQEAYDKPILGAAKNIVADFAAPGAYMANAANVIANKFRDDYIPTDTNSPAFRGAHMVRETSSGVTERARDAAGGGTAGEIASLAAGTGLSMANFLSKAPLGGVGSMAAMGLSSAGQTTLDVLERGGTEGQALLLGTAAGAIEAMTEKLPLDNLFKIAREAGETGIKATVKELLKQGAIEATEEMISELANTILDVEVMRDKSEYQSYIASLMQNGMTREDAEKEAIFQIYGMNTLKAGAEGFLSGLVMGGGATAVSKVNTAIESRNAGAAEGEAGFTKNEYSEKVSNKIIRALDAIGKKLGVNIQIGAPTGTGQGSFNGYYENGRIVISQDADDPLKVVLSHEVTHRMKETAPEEYAKFLEIAVNATEQLSGKQKSEILEEYKTWYSEYSQTDFKHENALDEITADFAGRLADDLSLFKKLVDTDRNVAQRFIDGVREFISKVKSTFSKDKSKADTASLEKYGLKVSELEEAVKQWSAMVKATETAVKSGNVEIENTAETEQGGVRQYDLKKVNGKTVAWIESNPLTNKQIENPEEVAKYVAQNINDMYAIIEDGVKVYIGEDLPNEYTMSKYSQAIRSEKSGKWKAKVKAAAGLDLLIEAATGRKWEKTKHPQNKDAKYGMYRYNSTFAFPIKDRKGNVTNIRVYDVEMLIRNASDGKKYLYDIVEIKEDIPSAKSLKQKEASRATYEAAQRGNIFNNSIHDSSGKSNPQFSLKKNTDNLGRKLSDGQVEYFKDSKVRDKDGSLLVMYRGGNENFTVFDRKKSKYSNLYGRGFYFTDSESHAKQYGNVRAYYLDIKNPVSITEKTITKEQLRSYLEAVAENEDDYSFENYGYGATVDSVLESVYEGKSDFNMLYDISQTAIGDMVEAVELFNEVNGTDYDGLILDTETVTFKSNQAKSVDNKKPTENPDIRYSLKGKKLIEPDVERKAERERMRELEAENAKQKNTAETKSEVKGGNIEQYTTEEADGIRKDSQTFRNIIAGTDITLGEFFKKWKLGRKNGEKLEKLYLGKASERVKKQIGELLGYDIPNRDFIITNDAIKHIFDEHGDEQKEESVGQVVIDEKTISVLREALNNPDSITKEIRKKEPRIVFKKKNRCRECSSC